MSKRRAKRPNRAQRKPPVATRNAARTKRLTLRIVFAGIMLGVVATYVIAEVSAESKTKSFCRKFPPGSYMVDVAHLARNEGDARYRSIEENEVIIAHVGIWPSSRHVCRIDGEAGRVTRVRYSHTD